MLDKRGKGTHNYIYEAKQTQLIRYRAAASRLARLCREPVVVGFLYRVARGGTERWQLTDKVEGKFRTVYVAREDEADVRAWTENWREARQTLREMSEAMRVILRENAAGHARSRCRTGASRQGGSASS